MIIFKNKWAQEFDHIQINKRKMIAEVFAILILIACLVIGVRHGIKSIEAEAVQAERQRIAAGITADKAKQQLFIAQMEAIGRGQK